MNETITETKSDTMSASLNVGVLSDLLSGALVATCKDSSLPTLTGIYLEFEAGVLKATATDRYRMISGETSATGEAFTALLPRDGVEKVIRICKDFKRSSLQVTLERVGFDQIRFTALDQSVTFRLLDGTFPPYVNLFGGDTVETGEIALNPRFLGDFAKVPGMDKSVPMRLTFHGSNKPVMVGIPHDSIAWKALLMPMRYAN